MTWIKAKLHKFISQQLPRKPATQPFERLAVDLVQLRTTSEHCYDANVWLFHAVCQNCKLYLAACLPNKTAPTLLATIKRLLAQISTQYGVKVCAVKINSKQEYSLLYQFFLDKSIEVEPRALYTEEQNGLIERTDSTIIVRGCAIQIGSVLSKNLANECAMTAVYLLNQHQSSYLVGIRRAKLQVGISL
jgi:hypothetical protein